MKIDEVQHEALCLTVCFSYTASKLKWTDDPSTLTEKIQGVHLFLTITEV